MLVQICLIILVATAITLVFVLIRLYSQSQQLIQLLQTDIHDLSKETISLITTMNEFVKIDLHATSKETCRLMSKLNELSSDINEKSHSLNFLFKPLNFLSSKIDEDSSSRESSSENDTVPQVLNWVVSSVRLFNTAKELIKNYAKRRQ